MTQQQLDREVAETLGENIRDIRQHGFSLATADDQAHDPNDDEYPAQVLDWDDYQIGNRVAKVTSFHEFYDPRAA